MSNFAMATQLWNACGKAVAGTGERLFGAYWRDGTAALGITGTPKEIDGLKGKYPDMAPAARDDRGRLVKA